METHVFFDDAFTKPKKTKAMFEAEEEAKKKDKPVPIFDAGQLVNAYVGQFMKSIGVACKDIYGENSKLEEPIKLPTPVRIQFPEMSS